MKYVHIPCPRCKTDNTCAVETLKSNGGHVVCSDCEYVFKVTPRRKAEAAAAVVVEPSPPAAPARPKPDTQKLAAAIHAIRMQTLAKTAPALVPKSNPHRPFTIIDEHAAEPRPHAEAAQPAIPSISIMLKQTISPVTPALINNQYLPFSLIDTPPEPQPASVPLQTQSNSMVFTLLPTPAEGAPAQHSLVINDNAVHSQEIAAAQLALAGQQANLATQFNWAMASLVALTVLIIQLFYLMTVS